MVIEGYVIVEILIIWNIIFSSELYKKVVKIDFRMRIPNQNLNPGFIAELLDLFDVKAKNSNNSLVLIEDNYSSTLFLNKRKSYIEFSSYLEVKDFGEVYLSFLQFMMHSHDERFDVIIDNCHNKNGSYDLIFLFKYDLRSKTYIEDIEILNLHNLFESLLYKANHICREIILRKNINKLEMNDTKLIEEINKLEKIYRR